jgi:hypothetical protein
MDLKELRTAQAPWITKAAVAVFLSAQVAVGLLCAIVAIHASASDKTALLQAAAYALGIGTPLFILALVIATARKGARAIEGRTNEILLHLLPRELRSIDLLPIDPSQHLTLYEGRRLRLSQVLANRNQPEVRVAMTSGKSTAHYEITAPREGRLVRAWLSVDFNLTQSTVCLRAPTSSLAGKQLQHFCQSTLEGAVTSGQYHVDGAERMDRIGGMTYATIILRTTFESDEFLWDTARTYFFATDLSLMVASFIRECGDLLAGPHVPSPHAAPAT